MRVGLTGGMRLQPTTTRSTRSLRADWRRDVLPTLHGDVLDIGAGVGVAADHLAADAHWIALEPGRGGGRELEARAAQRPGSEVLHAPAETIPLPDASVDAVICGTVLCSVRDPARALAEVRRVLRPGGRLVFFEHGAGPAQSGTRFLQRAYAPLSRIIDGGCDPARDTASVIRSAGFRSVDLREQLAPGVLGTVEPLITGAAVN
jgi:ubiquinone/menaquinone biosynthesis C-methylase UbiE